jgi:spore coat protein B
MQCKCLFNLKEDNSFMEREMMELFIGKTIKVDRGGPESRSGKLLAVFEDFFAILTESDGVVYYKTNHVRSITESSKDDMKFGLKVPNKLDFKTAENFHKLLESIRFQWIKVNRGGSESLEGVLSDVNKHYLSLIVKEEVVRFSMKHIRNISYGLMVDKKKDKDKDKDKSGKSKDDDKHDNKNDKSDDGSDNKNNKNNDDHDDNE